jgi:transcriptional regulator with XRE-family HTH domain
MNWFAFHRKLFRKASYRKAYQLIGNSVIYAVHFHTARQAAQLTRAELAKKTQLTIGQIAILEEEFNFRDEHAVSLIADCLKQQLRRCGLNPTSFFVRGATIAELSDKPRRQSARAKWTLKEVVSTNRLKRLHGLQDYQREATTPKQQAILRRVAAGEASPRDAVRDLMNSGLSQPRAERLVSLRRPGSGI